ncbi:MAG: deoxyguanosinetriphosphate triphosphohydrolase [Candidatus Omnitrophica bacterium]|nr:deoxyguanosinetriphosphate triphosphohydrolase [Candidatus Omnitrophota bacterium]
MSKLSNETLIASSDSTLAAYASKNQASRGRIYKEPEHAYRTIYQRDRDRIIHSASFRRLEYKTQVFVNHEGDYYRTRLTHTLEVAQIGRTIAKALNLNEELVEAIALAHDLGHTPFGHAGEDTLDDLMKEEGGFNHNLQGLRVVDQLEERYPDFPGLNLSWEVREGIAKHSTIYDFPKTLSEFEPGKGPSLETQVVDAADEIAYDNHDLDDGLTSGLLKADSLRKIDFWREIEDGINKRYPEIGKELQKYQIINSLINFLVTDIINESKKRLKKFNIKNVNDAKEIKEKIITFSNEVQKKRGPLREFLFKNLYNHYRVIRMSDKAKRFIKDLFNVYLEKPQQLPIRTQEHFKNESIKRVVCDYIAGMTDRFALNEYKKLFDPYEKV